MPRMYTAASDQVSVANASGDYDLMELAAAVDKPIRIAKLVVSQKSEIGDAQEEMISLAIWRGNTTSGNGTSVTPRSVTGYDATAGFTAETFGSTPATAGTGVLLYAENFNLRAGSATIEPENLRLATTNGLGLLCIRMGIGVTDDATFSITAYIEELP